MAKIIGIPFLLVERTDISGTPATDDEEPAWRLSDLMDDIDETYFLKVITENDKERAKNRADLPFVSVIPSAFPEDPN